MYKNNNVFKNNKCRTCFNSSKGLKSLTELANADERQISYAEMLKAVANINVMDKIYRKMPHSICTCCSRKLKTAHSFVQQAQEVNEKLWSLLSEPDTDCLQETQIDQECCLEIKLENVDLQNEIEVECNITKMCKDEKSINQNVTTQKKIKSLGKSDYCQSITSELKLKDIDNGTNSNTIETKPMEMILLKKSIDFNTIKPDINRSDSDPDIFEPCIDKSDSENAENDNVSYHTDDSDCQENKNQSHRIKINRKDIAQTRKYENEDIAVPCNKCNKIFVNFKALTIHQRISHIPEEQKCACTTCGRKFTRYCNMYKHMRTFHGPESVTLIRQPAEGENVYQCDRCPKKYARKKSLNTHIRRKHSIRKELLKPKIVNADTNKKHADKGSLCPICGSSFTSKTQLTVHIRRHTGERPFKCNLCDRAFLLATHLTSHIRLHTGEKPFKCQLCDKAFRVSGKLAQHMRSHSDERPYKCSQCERSFKYSQDLNIHKRSHTGERPYSCEVCGNAFQRYNSLRDHRTRMGHMENAVHLENQILDNS